MQPIRNSRLPAFLCVLMLLVAAAIARPFAEIGMSDDWSYVLTSRVLARTGHLVYNGWATAMLGWQFYFGALFVKLFGPSFTAVRASTFVLALVTAFLTQRTLVRAGLNATNSVLATIALFFSCLLYTSDAADE